MKKVLIAVIVLFISLFISYDIKASSDDSFNKINNAIFEVDINSAGDYPNFSYLQIDQKQLISLEADKEYFILSTYVNKQNFGTNDVNWYELPLLPDGILLNTYNNYGEVMQKPLTKKLTSDGILCGYAFKLEEGWTSVSFGKILLEGTMSQVDFRLYYETYINDLSNALVLLEANNLKYLPGFYGYSYYYNHSVPSYNITSLYFGEDLSIFTYGNTYPKDESNPTFNPNNSTFTTNINNPISIEDMIFEIGLSAYDDIDGDITDRIIVADDGRYNEDVYFKSDAKYRKLGLFPITFSVSDNSGNTESCIINIDVIDNSPPTVNPNSILEYQLRIEDTPITIDEIIANIEVTDNHSTVEYYVISEDYTENQNVVGVFNYVIGFIDSSGNFTEVTVILNNNDLIAPMFSFLDTEYIVSYLENPLIENIINEMNISVSDNYYQVTFGIIEDNYSSNYGNVGDYTVLLESIDGSNNRAELILTIHIIDDQAPVFFVNDAFVNADIDKLVSKTEIKAILIDGGHTKNDKFTIQVISDNYSDNYDKTGEYQMRLKLTYENGEIEYKNIGFDVTEQIEELNFLTKAWEEIKKISQYIWNIIKWPFEKILALF